jgi:hypothetical protein
VKEPGEGPGLENPTGGRRYARPASGRSEREQLVREDTEILGVEIPNEAAVEQAQWVRDPENAQDEEFDKLFVGSRRASHDKIFAAIGNVRAPRNDLVRRHSCRTIRPSWTT